MKTKFLILFAVIFFLGVKFSPKLFAQTCDNLNFSSANFDNWKGMTGDYLGTKNPLDPFKWLVSGIPANTLPTLFTTPSGSTKTCKSKPDGSLDNERFKVITRNASNTDSLDRFTLNQLPIFPADPSVTNIVRVGNACGGAEAEGLVYSYTPHLSTCLLVLNYALVLESPDHKGRQNPSIQIHVREKDPFDVGAVFQVTERLECAQMDVIAEESSLIGKDPAYHQAGTGLTKIVYREWTKVGIYLKDQVGAPVEIQFNIGDCELNGHFSYAYLSGTCGPADIQEQGLSNVSETSDTAAIVTAPDGFIYEWRVVGDADQAVLFTGQTFEVRDYVFDIYGNKLTLECTLISFAKGIDGTQCRVPLTIEVVNKRPDVKFEYVTDTCDKTYTYNFESKAKERESKIDPASYRWDFGDGTPEIKGVINPEHSYAQPGTYYIQHWVSSVDGVWGYDKMIIVIEEVPEARISRAGVDVTNETSDACVGELVKLECASDKYRESSRWNVDGVDFYGEALDYAYNEPTTVWLYLNDTKGCTDSVSHTINAIPLPVINFIGDTAICKGNTATVTAQSDSPGASYIWNEGTQGPQIVKKPISDTSFTVTVTDAYGCVASKKAYINTVTPQFTLSKERVCPGDTLILTASNAASYTWKAEPEDPISPITGITDEVVTVFPQEPTTYSLIGFGSNGCEAEPVVKAIKIVPYPIAKFQTIPEFIDSENPVVSFRDISANRYTTFWDFGDGATSSQKDPNHKYMDLSKDTITVYLWSYNELGCSDSTYKNLPVGIFAIWHPNSFTPDDTKNNTFGFTTKNDVKDFEVLIYDRWGQKVFESKDIHTTWDGTYKGKKCPIGVYVWVMSYKRPESNRQYQEKGSLNLIR